MNLAINIGLIGTLGVLVYQDFKHRAISWMFLLLLALLLVGKALLTVTLPRIGGYFLVNSAILIIQFVLLIAYFRMKGHTFTGFWENVMGSGDFLFLLCMCLAFAPVNFILFFLSGLFFTLFGYGVMRILKYGTGKPIPFAGFLSLFLILFIVGTETFWKWNSYDNELLLNLIKR